VKTLRLLLVSGVLSYRALFNWIHPTYYVPAMLGGPIFQILFFAYLGRFSRLDDDAFFVFGNAIQIVAVAGIFGMVMGVAGERWAGTLSPLLASPANRAVLFFGRSLPFLVNGLFVSVCGFAAGWLLLDFRLEASALAPLALVVLVTAASCTAFGLAVGSVGLWGREVFVLANLVYTGMLVVCGVNFPVGRLPAAAQLVGRVLPVTHGIRSGRALGAGASVGDVLPDIAREAAVGLAYAVVALALFRFFERDARRRGTLERI